MACSTKSLRELTPARRRLSSHSFRCRGVTASPDFTRFSNISGPPSGTMEYPPENSRTVPAISGFLKLKVHLVWYQTVKTAAVGGTPARIAGPVFLGRNGTSKVHAPLSSTFFGWLKRPQNGLISRGESGAAENGSPLPHSFVTRLWDLLQVLGWGYPSQAHTGAHSVSPVPRLRHTAADSGCGIPGGFG